MTAPAAPTAPTIEQATAKELAVELLTRLESAAVEYGAKLPDDLTTKAGGEAWTAFSNALRMAGDMRQIVRCLR